MAAILTFEIGVQEIESRLGTWDNASGWTVVGSRNAGSVGRTTIDTKCSYHVTTSTYRATIDDAERGVG